MTNRITHNFFILLLLISIFLAGCSKSKIEIPVVVPPPQSNIPSNIFPDKIWNDINGSPINAHSASIYFENGTYYWYGENKIKGSSESRGFTGAGMHAYKSTDLINWTDLGLVLSVDNNNANSDIAFGCIFQRPKVVYNASTKKYIAFFKLYLKGNGYNICHTGVAIADKPEGPFVYSHKFLPTSLNGAGDYTFFKDNNGDLYHITVRKSDRVMVKAKMSADYLNPATSYVPCPGIAVSTEAPAIFLRNGVYHLFGSGSDGWEPTAPRYYTSTSLDGPWTSRPNPCIGTNPISNLGANKTFGGQSTHIQKVEGKDNQYILLMDVWIPTDAYNSRYIWLPFKVNDTNNRLTINWVNQWNLKWFDNN